MIEIALSDITPTTVRRVSFPAVLNARHDATLFADRVNWPFEKEKRPLILELRRILDVRRALRDVTAGVFEFFPPSVRTAKFERWPPTTIDGVTLLRRARRKLCSVH